MALRVGSSPQEIHETINCRRISKTDRLFFSEQVNNIEPIWMLEKNKITDEMHNSFYQFLTGEPGAFRFNLYYKTEMPISVRSIFYIPKDRPSMMSADDRKSEISLYCRKVLIR